MFPSSGDLLVFSTSGNISTFFGRHTAFEASDNTALKATVLPMLMSETIHTNTAVATIALAGTWKRGLTLEVGPFVSMLRRGSRDECTHCSKPLGKRQTVIACEGEHLARARGQSTDGYHDQKDKDNADEARRTTYALCGVLENVDERVAGGVTERFANVADAERIAGDCQLLQRFEICLYLRDQEEKSKRHVEQERHAIRSQRYMPAIRPGQLSNNLHHGFGYDGTRVLDFFGHVSDTVLTQHYEHARYLGSLCQQALVERTFLTANTPVLPVPWRSC